MSLDVVVRGITIPADELTWRFSRSQGPGGQSVNTTDSQAELSYDLAGSAALPPVLKQRALPLRKFPPLREEISGEESPGSMDKRCRITSGGREPRESATENIPPQRVAYCRGKGEKVR
jgi:hypothetical protein